MLSTFVSKEHCLYLVKCHMILTLSYKSIEIDSYSPIFSLILFMRQMINAHVLPE